MSLIRVNNSKSRFFCWVLEKSEASMWRTATFRLRSPLRLPGARRMCSTESTSEPARRTINDRLLDGAQKLVVTSLLLLTIGILSAYKIPASFLQDHPITPLYIVLAIYALLVGIALTRGLAPRRLAVLSIVAFAFPIISLWLVSSSH